MGELPRDPEGRSRTPDLERSGRPREGQETLAHVGVFDLLLSGVLALAAGAGLWLLWWRAGYPAGAFVPGLDGHGPDPLAWPHLVAVWVPATHGLFTLAHALLGWKRPSTPLRRLFLADQATLGLVPGLALALALLGGHGSWQLVIGAWYTLWILLKSALLLGGLWLWLPAAPDTRAATIAVLLGALVPYVGLSGHVVAALSTSSDEPYYLLVTHSLLHDGDVDLANNLERHDYLPFYWGNLPRDPRALRPGPHGEVYASLYQTFQAVLLLPGYWAAGRVGALLTLNLFAAAALALLFRYCRAEGATLRAAFLAWVGAAFSAPFVIYAASPFPEVSGALFVTAAALLLRRAPVGWARRLAAGLCLGAMLATKIRFLVLVPPLALGFARLTRAGLVALGVGLAATLALVAAYDARLLSGFVAWRAGSTGLLATTGWLIGWTWRAPTEYRGQLGMLLDQEFGLFAAAPVFLLAPIGLVLAAAERRWRLLFLAGGPFLFAWYYLGAANLVGIAHRGVSQWYGGFSPPARFLVATLPLLSVFVALAIDRVRGRFGWSVALGVSALSLAYAAVISVWPAWRFQHALGRTTVLRHLFWRIGLDPGSLLPSFVADGGPWLGPAAILLAALVAVGFRLSRRPGTAPPRGALPAGVLGALAGLLGLVGWTWWQPPDVYPAVLGHGRGGIPFLGRLAVDGGHGSEFGDRLVWAAQRDAVLELAPRMRAGRYRITLRAGAQGSGSGPTLLLTAAGAVMAPMALDAGPPPAWREREYTYETWWRGGRLPLLIELRGITRGPPERLAYLDTIRLERLGR